MLTFAVLGFGARGKNYTGLIKQLQQNSVLAVCDPDTARLAIAKEIHNIPEEMLFTDEDAFFSQGKLADIKTKFRSEAYLLELEKEEDILFLAQAFVGTRQVGVTQLIFREGKNTVFEVLNFVSERRIALLKMERVEPTLEDLFMEVTGK